MDSYKNAQDDIRPGGGQDRARQATLAERRQLESQRVDIEDHKLQVERDTERVAKNIAAAQEDSKRSDVDLQAAFELKRITREKYEALKREQAAVKADLASLQLKDSVDPKGARSDPVLEAEKQKKLDALKARQKQLQDQLKAVLKT